MPLDTAGPFISDGDRQVASSPVTAEASVGAIQMRGLRRMLGICSMEVPRPWLISPLAVLPIGNHGEAHHLCAAASHGRAARKPCQRQRRAQISSWKWRASARHAHSHGYQHAHQERLQVGRPLDKIAHSAGRPRRWRARTARPDRSPSG